MRTAKLVRCGSWRWGGNFDAALPREIRILAAEEGTSISAMLASRLEQILLERKSYDRSRRRALARLREGIDRGWTPPGSRDGLYERRVKDR